MRRDQDHVGVRCVLVVLVLAMAPAAAMAYIDPGNGAYMVQALFALVGAALFYLRHPIQSLKTFWGWLASRRGHPARLDHK
jgi:drug/metabolite transporter (DMT)-like permease